MDKAIKIGLAILLFLCLMDWPYGYFQLVRFAALIGFGILAFHANAEQKQTETIVFIGLAILFQPIFKIALGRELWNIIDVVVAIFLLISLVKKEK
jgi:hypothetical protein